MENISSDTRLSTKIMLSAFIMAYLHGADVGTAVYDNFINRMTNDNSPQYEERKKILYNCYHFFTNSNSKKQMDNLKQQMLADGKAFSCNNIVLEILSKFPEVIFADYSKGCFAAVTVLPLFAHAYTNGLDIETVYEQLANKIPSDNNPQHVEERAILVNCLSLFKNSNCVEEINSLQQNLTEAGRDISDYKFAREILSNFPEMILSTKRREFAEIVLTSFVHAHAHKLDVEALYDKLKNRIPDDNSLQNAERRKVLENCLSLFRNTKKELHVGDELSDEELAKKIMDTFSGTILGDNKRKYDMSDKYSELMIDSKSFNFIPSNVYDELYLKDDNSNARIMICRLGKLTYGTASVRNESIDKYAVSILEGTTVIQRDDVFSDINFDALLKDEDYRQAVLEGLLNINTIELSNAGGYIGVLDSPNTNYEQQISVGEEIDNGYGTYRYRISEKYHLVVESEPATAVMMWNRIQELNNNKEIKKGDPR